MVVRVVLAGRSLIVIADDVIMMSSSPAERHLPTSK